MHKWWDCAPEVGRQLKNTPPDTRAALKALQPFYGVPRINPSWHPLFLLSELNNRDKHRRLNVLSRAVELEVVDANGKPIFQRGIPPIQDRIPERRERDTYPVVFRVLPEYANMEMYLLSEFKVTLDEPPELISDLVQTLTRINEYIDREVFPTVKALL